MLTREEPENLIFHTLGGRGGEGALGRHGVRAFSDFLSHSFTKSRALEAAMTEALEHGGFALHQQPQDKRNGRLAGFEALIRFPHPVPGMISPARLIPIAEESQMIFALGRWLLREACEQSCR